MNAIEYPVAVRMVDIGVPLRPIDDVARYPRVRVFVVDRGELLGSVDIWNGGRSIPVSQLASGIADALSQTLVSRAVASRLRVAKGRDGSRADEGLPVDVPVSIVVPTCDRPNDLRRCLVSLLTQRSPRRLEIIVVDNRPGESQTRSIVREFPSAILVEEHRPGLSYARNAGFAAATGEILVATDDDVVAPPDWLEKLVAPFARREVAVVCGHVLPLELETESQCRFEAYGGLGKGFRRLEVDGAWFRSRRSAVPTWHLGATANAAFRASVLADEEIGLMDEALGAGTPTGCSEDTYVFYRVLKAGHTIAYEPSAYVWHRHRGTMDAVRRQIYAYSKGHAAYHVTTLLNDRDHRALIRLFWSLPKTYLRRAVERLRRRSEYPLSLIGLEVLGTLAGPWALWRSRRRVRRLGSGPKRLARTSPFNRITDLPDPPSPRVPEPPRAPEPPGLSDKSHAVSLEGTLTQNPAP